MRAVQPLEIGPGETALRRLDDLDEALAGRGPLLVPHAPGEAPADLPAASDVAGALAVGTSGSTGSPKRAVLTAEALRASAAATDAALGGPGRWLLALPPHHIAGVQVLLRSIAAGYAPGAVPAAAGFSPGLFAAASAALAPAPRRYVSLVPTQLHRILADAAATAALASFDGVLVGGAATAPALLDRARAAGARIVTTYGMSETAGGCVYDGTPLRCTRVRLDADGLVRLGGETLASGYLGLPDGHPAAAAFSTDDAGTRWLRTGDLGHLDADGRLCVDGRGDDVVVSGGLKIAPGVVERALADLLPAGSSAVVVGVPDDEWGQVVGVALAPGDGDVAGLEAGWAGLVAPLREAVGATAVPRRVRVLERLPLRGPGKPDRRALAELLRDAPARPRDAPPTPPGPAAG